MNFFKMFFNKQKIENKKCGGCKQDKRGETEELISELNALKDKYNDLELEYIELENINSVLNSKNEELKSKNEELISILIKVSDISRVGVECSKKGY